MMRQLGFPDSIRDIYFIANTPLFLYQKLRENDFVVSLSEANTEELIEEFRKRINSPIRKDSELAEVYAILIALSFKKKDEVEKIFKEASQIKYEWFSIIANYYLQNYNPPPTFSSYSVEPSNLIVNSGVKMYGDDSE